MAANGGLGDEHFPQALPEDIAELATHKIKKGVVRFLSSSKFVTSKSTSKLPKFTREEIVLGKLLGSGGFSHVYEIKSISPAQSNKCKFSENEEQRRSALTENARRRYKGKAPYVVKHMKEKFLDNPNKFRHAGTDLVIEAYFLASLSHPHIVTIRGWSAGGGSAYLSGRNDGFFLVMDRLEETLDDRIKHWSKQLKRYKQPILQKINGNVKELLFAGRLQVARDIASALTYLHEHGIVYRDLKPGNIGFDSEGVVKLFDFGLSREIPDSRKAVAEEMPGGDKLFDLSGKIGTQRYMAPEVGCCYPYNQKADVYSLSLVLWECLSLEKPFANHSKSLHRAMVLEGDERPQIESSWPYGVQALLQCSWSADIRVRPTMRALQTVLSREIEDLRVERAQPTKTRRYSLKLSRMSSNRSFGTTEASGMSAFTAESMDV